jgi:hypothetical protein
MTSREVPTRDGVRARGVPLRWRRCRGFASTLMASAAISSGGRKRSTKDLRGFHPTEALSRAIVQFSSDGRQVCAAEEILVSAFGNGVTKQTIGSLVPPDIRCLGGGMRREIHGGVVDRSGVIRLLVDMRVNAFP